MKAAARQHIGLNHAGDEFGESPRGAYFSLSLSSCLCLHPTPTHKSSSSPIKALVRSEGTCFLSCFHHFMSDHNVFPMSDLSLCLSPPCLLFPVPLSSSYPPPSLMAERSKYLANVLNVQLNTHTLVKAVALWEKTFIIYIEREAWEERGSSRQQHISLITEGYSILLRSGGFIMRHRGIF